MYSNKQLLLENAYLEDGHVVESVQPFYLFFRTIASAV